MYLWNVKLFTAYFKQNQIYFTVQTVCVYLDTCLLTISKLSRSWCSMVGQIWTLASVNLARKGRSVPIFGSLLSLGLLKRKPAKSQSEGLDTHVSQWEGLCKVSMSRQYITLKGLKRLSVTIILRLGTLLGHNQTSGKLRLPAPASLRKQISKYVNSVTIKSGQSGN